MNQSNSSNLNRRFCRPVLAFAMLLSLIACSSVPISSAIKMATMDERDIATINPRDVRVRLTVDKPAELMEKDVRLVLEYKRKDKSKSSMSLSEFHFILKLLNKKAMTESSIFSADKKVTQYEFSIADESVREFYRHQREFLREGKPDHYHWTVFYYLQNKSVISDKLSLDVELKLRPLEDYFYLFENAAVKVNSGDAEP